MREGERKKEVSKRIRSSFMCHFHLVSFVAVTKLFLLISSGSLIQLWWKLQSFTQRIMGIASTDSSAGKGTVRSSMEHQWPRAVGYYCYRGEQGGKSEYPSLQNGFALADGETGPCYQIRNAIVLHTFQYFGSLSNWGLWFGFIYSPLLQKWCYKFKL